MAKAFRFLISYDPPKDWNSVVKTHSGFLIHTTYWASIFEKLGVGRGRYLRVYKKDQLIIQMLLWESLIGSVVVMDYLPKWILKALMKLPYFTTVSFHLAPNFLVKADESEKEHYINEIIVYLAKLAKKERKSIGPASFMYTQSKESVEKTINNLPENIEGKIVGTVRVAVEQDEDRMFQKIEYSRRKNIKRAERLGVTVREADISKIDFYWNELKKSWSDYKLYVSPLSYYQAFPKEYTKLFFAYKDNELIAGNGVLQFGKTSIEFSIFISNYEKKEKTRGGDLIKWYLIKDCLKLKIHLWDLNMIDLSESEEKTKKINFYKLEWGGEISYGLSLVYYPSFIRLLQMIKQRFLGK